MDVILYFRCPTSFVFTAGCDIKIFRYFTSQRSKIFNAKITLKHKYWYFASQRSKIVNAKTQVFFFLMMFRKYSFHLWQFFFNVISRNACKNLLLIGGCHLCVVTVEYRLKIMQKVKITKMKTNTER